MKQKFGNNWTYGSITLGLLIGVIFFGWQLGERVMAQMSDFGDVDITAVVPGPPTNSGSGSVNNGPVTTITFSGLTAPKSRVIILKDGQIFNTFYSADDGSFQVVINNQSYGVYNYGLYYEDPAGNMSNILPLQINAFTQEPIAFNNIVLPPTLVLSQTIANPGTVIQASGYTVPGATVFLTNSQNSSNIISVVADAAGKYNANFTIGSALGDFSARARAKINGYESIHSRNTFYTVWAEGQEPVLSDPSPGAPRVFPTCADPNRNGRVNLVDFSIMLFWYEKPNPPQSLDCNGDGVVNLTDFSVLMYYWTG